VLKGVAAGVVKVVRSILAFFAGRPRKEEAPREAAAIAAAHAAILATDAVLSAGSMAAVTIDRTTIAADTAATAARVAVAATRIDATASRAEPAAADAAPAPVDTVEPAPADAVPELAVIAPAAAAVPAAVDVAAPAPAVIAPAPVAVMPETVDVAPAAPRVAPAPAAAPPAPAVAPASALPRAAATAIGTVKLAKPQGRKAMSSGFDMQAEIAKLAERIIEPVAAKLSDAERAEVTGQTRDAFEQLNADRPAPDVSFEHKAVTILGPVEPRLTTAERKRVVDRLSGAMAAFCQGLGQGAGRRAA
jgi:hypothetical protein